MPISTEPAILSGVGIAAHPDEGRVEGHALPTVAGSAAAVVVTDARGGFAQGSQINPDQIVREVE